MISERLETLFFEVLGVHEVRGVREMSEVPEVPQ